MARAESGLKGLTQMDIEIGKLYIVTLRGRRVKAKLLEIAPPSHGRHTRYVFYNTETMHNFIAKSPKRILRIVD